MARIAYFDCFSGASGDMIIGSLLDAGLDFEVLKKGLAGLDLHGYRLSVEKVLRSSITATKFNVLLDEEEHDHEHGHEHHHGAAHGHQTHRGLTEILRIIETGDIPESTKKKSAAIFRKLGTVEAGIHGVPLEEVHFHELGAVDTIVDIVGTVLGLEALKIEKVYSSSLVVGSGTVNTAHGILPVPAPATLQILADARAPIVDAPPSEKPPGELLTPTGAVLLTSLSSGFKRPNLNASAVGYGAGNKQFATWPNVVRIWIGEASPEVSEEKAASSEASEDKGDRLAGGLVLLETNIDDMNPQIYGHLMDRLLEAGAADVWFTPIQMKKNRPAIMLSVLGPASAEDLLTGIVMRETSTLGIRSRRVSRHTAHREIIELDTSLGRARAKVKRFKEFLAVSPEYEDCRRIAVERGLPLQEVTRIVESEARQYLARPS
jgi:pyridinium-3,5-bisthiocarboxylic acid mononucleotide nickel chelatase